MTIEYGGMVFFTNRLYRISYTARDRTIAGKRVWVKELVRNCGCDWLRVVFVDGDTEKLVKPTIVIPI